MNLEFRQCIPNLQYVAGAGHIYEEFVATANQVLNEYSLEQLLHEHARELNGCDWDDPASPDFFDMKKGCGGMLEHEFITVLASWQRLRGLPLSQDQLGCYRIIQRHRLFVAQLKHFMCQVLRRSVHSRQQPVLPHKLAPLYGFFCSPNAVKLMALESHSFVAQFVGLLPRELQHN